MAARAFRFHDTLISVALFLIVLATYWPVRHFDFVRFDDPVYLTENAHAVGGLTRASVNWAVTSLVIGNYMPVAVLSSLLDVSVWGMRAGPMHLENAVIHGLAAVGWYLLWIRLTGLRGRSAMVAALFALHPMHVESVAWIVERCDVLCMLFMVVSLLAFTEYVQQKRKIHYLLSLLMMILAVLSKPAAIVLPGLLLLLDIWPMRRWRRGAAAPDFVSVSTAQLAGELTPFAGVALVAAVLAGVARASQHGTLSLQVWTITDRAANVAFGYCSYLLKAVWPEPMVVLYPLRHTYSTAAVVVAWILLVLVTAAIVRVRRRRPYLLFGWLWFIGTLLPNIGFVQTGAQSMADRYTYLSYVGLSVAVIWWIGDVLGRLNARTIARVMSAAALFACVVETRRQLAHWQNNYMLYSHAWQYEPDDDIISNAMGAEYTIENRPDLALEAFSRSVAVDPYNSNAQTNLGNLLLRIDARQALPHLQWAVRAGPDDPVHWWDLGVCQQQLKQYPDAATSYQKVLQLDPHFQQAIDSLKSLPTVH